MSWLLSLPLRYSRHLPAGRSAFIRVHPACRVVAIGGDGWRKILKQFALPLFAPVRIMLIETLAPDREIRE